MGRKIRKVPAGWDHPKDDQGNLRPLFDENYEQAMDRWINDHRLWLEGKHPSQLKYPEDTSDCKYFAEWASNAPDLEFYRRYKDEECTHFQMYETVTEGTPCTPVFASLKDLEDYLVEVGEMAGTKWNRKYSREAAHEFCKSGYACTAVIIPGQGIMNGLEGAVIK